jgi:hypothetical protein
MDTPVRVRRDAETAVTMTPGRWIASCVLGCLLLAVALLPPSPSSDDDAPYRWQTQWTTHEHVVERRVQIARSHSVLLWRAYRAAHDADVAMREFATGHTAVSAPAKVSIWFDADVPPAARRRISELVTAENSARGRWHGAGSVGVLVFTDTATSIDRVPMPWGYNSALTLSTKVLPPIKEIGDRCVTVIRVGRAALIAPDTISADRQLLDACAFTDAFGTPGPQIQAWLLAGHMGFARSLSLVIHDSAATPGWASYDFLYSNDAYSRCAGDDLPSCSSLLSEAPGYYWWDYWHDRSVSMPSESSELTQAAGGFSATLLDAMVRDLGPDRFQRVWQSPRSFDAAYLGVTGEPLAAWVHRQVVARSGPYHIGPLPTATSAILTLFTIAASLAISVRMARRPAAT